MICTTRWIGGSSATMGSRRRWRRAIWARGRWHATISRRALLRAVAARWPSWATAATADAQATGPRRPAYRPAWLPGGGGAALAGRAAQRLDAPPRRRHVGTQRIAPCRTNSAPSCVTPAALEVVVTRHRPSRSSLRRPSNRRGHSNCSKPSQCSQNDRSAESANRVIRQDKCAILGEELQFN